VSPKLLFIFFPQSLKNIRSGTDLVERLPSIQEALAGSNPNTMEGREGGRKEGKILK
jgi:hypothetical protein